MDFSISDILSAAWAQAKRFGWVYALVYFLVSLLFTGVSLSPTLALSSTPVSFLLTSTLMLGFVRGMLRQVRGHGAHFGLDDLNMGWGLWGKALVVQLIVGLVVLVGSLFCLLPGLYLYARLGFAAYCILDHPEMSIGAAIRASWQMTQGSALRLCLCIVVLGLIQLSGVLFCFVGIYFTTIILLFGMVLLYHHFQPQPTADGDAYARFQERNQQF